MNGPPGVGLRDAERAGWCEPLRVQHRAFSREPPPEHGVGRAGRPPVTGQGRSCALIKCAVWRIAGGTAEEFPSSPWGRRLFYSSPSVPCRPIPEGALPSVKEMDHNETTIGRHPGPRPGCFGRRNLPGRPGGASGEAPWQKGGAYRRPEADGQALPGGAACDGPAGQHRPGRD